LCSSLTLKRFAKGTKPVPFRPDRVKGLRDAKGWSQKQLAKHARLSRPLITKSEKGKNSPRSDALDQLAQALDCTTDYLLGRGPDYDTPAAAASHMAFEVFIAQQEVGDERREKCRRALRHRDAPKTAQAWRSFAEMIELATGPTPSITSVAPMGEQRTKSKPMAVVRRTTN
jgi:transcriptional regulator with XRE-family HTH domain